MVQKMRWLVLGAVAALPIAIISCGKSSSSAASAYSAEKPSAMLGLVGSAISAAATDMKTSTLAQYGAIHSKLSDDVCSDHGDPEGLDWGAAGYPGTLTYCKMSINDGSPDTIQGGFTLVKSISCALEAAGITFDGVERATAITLTSACFTAAQMADMGGEGAVLNAKVTASSPASFNANYERGVIIDVTDAGMLFKLASRVSGDKVEFVTMEDQGTTRTGMTAGSLDLGTGEVRFEARMERINCTESGSCGWNRNIRLYANMTMENGAPKDLESISFGYSNIQAPPGQTGYGGVVVTASGDLTTGIKARLFQATSDGVSAQPTSQTDYQSVAKWVEITNSKCYTSSSESATTCGAGLANFTTSAAFALTGTYTTALAHGAAINGQSYTAVDMNADTQ